MVGCVRTYVRWAGRSRGGFLPVHAGCVGGGGDKSFHGAGRDQTLVSEAVTQSWTCPGPGPAELVGAQGPSGWWAALWSTSWGLAVPMEAPGVCLCLLAVPRGSREDGAQLFAPAPSQPGPVPGPAPSGVFEGSGLSPPLGQLFGCGKQQGSGGLPLFSNLHPTSSTRVGDEA